jgi:hypothetical protein
LPYLDSNQNTGIKLILKEERFNPNIFCSFKKYSNIKGFYLEIIKEKIGSHIPADNYQVCDFQSIAKLKLNVIDNSIFPNFNVSNQFLPKIN